MMNRWTTYKQELRTGRNKQKRPHLASECDSLGEAERHRRGILGEITRKVAMIQNAGLGEHRLRELNDEINKSFREKKHWERQILKLGGRNYSQSAPRQYDADDCCAPGSAAAGPAGALTEE